MSNPEDDEYLPHEWPEQHCGKCGKPVGGETLFARGQFFHSVCLGRKIDPPAGVRIGDAVAWANVPDGALVRWLWDGHGLEYFYRRHEYCVSLVGSYDGSWCPAGRDDGSFASSEPVTIVALGLTGRETADDLRRMAEVYEVREAMLRSQALALAIFYGIDEAKTQAFAERLHAAGWRPGMTAEDAARLLAAEEAR